MLLLFYPHRVYGMTHSCCPHIEFKQTQSVHNMSLRPQRAFNINYKDLIKVIFMFYSVVIVREGLTNEM